MANHMLGILIGFFIIALALNFFLLTDAFTDYTLQITDASGNKISKSIFTIPNTIPNTTPSLDQGKLLKDMINQMIGVPPASLTQSTLTGTPNADLSAYIQKTVQTEVNKSVKDAQNTDALKYKLDKQSQQKCNDTDVATDCASPLTPSLAQGSEYCGANGATTTPYSQGQTSSQNSEACPYDMTEYVRKDKIPCWGCSLK
jgi:hypothetical protein